MKNHFATRPSVRNNARPVSEQGEPAPPPGGARSPGCTAWPLREVEERPGGAEGGREAAPKALRLPRRAGVSASSASQKAHVTTK